MPASLNKPVTGDHIALSGLAPVGTNVIDHESSLPISPPA